jgi:hypothetical protein
MRRMFKCVQIYTHSKAEQNRERVARPWRTTAAPKISYEDLRARSYGGGASLLDLPEPKAAAAADDADAAADKGSKKRAKARLTKCCSPHVNRVPCQ